MLESNKRITTRMTEGSKMLTLRLDSEMERKLTNLAIALGMSKSAIVRQSLQLYINKIEKNNAWEAGKELFGKYSSGQTDLSSNRKTILKQKLRDKINAKNSN